MKTKLLFLAFIFTICANAQAMQDWSQYLYGNGAQIYGPKALNNVITNDASGNIYAIGVFNSTNGNPLVDLDPSAGVFNLNLYSGNIYITKTDESGNFIWARQIGGSGPAFSSSITLDPDGNIYISGKVGFGFWDFNPSPTINTNTYVQESQANFIEKLNPDGSLVWVKLIKNIYDESFDQINDITVDASGNVYATGSYRLNADFDPGTGVVNLSPDTDAFIQIFVLKLDSSGNYVWAKAFKQSSGGSTIDIGGHAIKSDTSGNIYICGYSAQGITDFDPGVGIVNKTSIHDTSLFITKLNAMGELVWVNTYEKLGYSSIGFESKLVLDTANNPIVLDYTYTNGVSTNSVLKVDGATGADIWTKTIAGVTVIINQNLTTVGFCESNDMTLDASGNIYITGRFSNTVDFDPGVGIVTLTPDVNPNSSGTNFDGYFEKLDPNGNFVWTNKIGGLGNDYVSNILVTPLGKIIIRGIAGVGGFNRTTTATAEGAFLASFTQPTLANSQFELDKNILIYPNPTNNILNLKSRNNLKNANFKIISIAGQTVFEKQSLSGLDFSFDVSNLSSGLYIIEIYDGNNVFNSKFIKQ